MDYVLLLVVCCLLFDVECRVVVGVDKCVRARCGLFVVGCWLLVIGYVLFVVCCLLLVVVVCCLALLSLSVVCCYLVGR